MDFAAIHNAYYQDEVKAAAYYYNQITMTHYRDVLPPHYDKEAPLDESDLTRHLVTINWEDNQHDYHTVEY